MSQPSLGVSSRYLDSRFELGGPSRQRSWVFGVILLISVSQYAEMMRPRSGVVDLIFVD
jgi:hypothetical protein